MKKYTSQDWYNLVKDLYELIISDMDKVADESLPETYPKIVIMYEFFRLVRGEAFYAFRPNDIGEFQREIYRMEYEMGQRLDQLTKKLDPNDSKTKYHLDLMKRSFNL